MTQLTPPPIKDPVTARDGFANISWILHFNQQYEGDAGTSWNPTFSGLTQTGTPTITGRYYRISRRIVYFWVRIVPGTDTTATAGTTYISNFPLTTTSDGLVFAVSGNLGSGSGHIVSSNNRIYVPAWSAVTVPLTLVGICTVAP